MLTLTKGTFYCKDCEITWKSEYKPQVRPRRSCPNCHKSCDLDKNNKGKNVSSSQIITPPSSPIHSSLPNYENVNIKQLIKDACIDAVYKDKRHIGQPFVRGLKFSF